MMILRVLAVFLGPPAVASALAFARHPDLLDVAIVTPAYFVIPYWLVTIPWFVLAARRRVPPRPPGMLTRMALVLAAPLVMYALFWWGGLGFGAALLVVATVPRPDWLSPRAWSDQRA